MYRWGLLRYDPPYGFAYPKILLESTKGGKSTALGTALMTTYFVSILLHIRHLKRINFLRAGVVG